MVPALFHVVDETRGCRSTPGVGDGVVNKPGGDEGGGGGHAGIQEAVEADAGRLFMACFLTNGLMRQLLPHPCV